MAILRRQFAAALAVTGLGVGLAGCAVPRIVPAHPLWGVADSLYWNGPILTMNDAQPQVEAVAVRAGRIVAAGRSCGTWPAGRGRPPRWWTCKGAR